MIAIDNVIGRVPPLPRYIVAALVLCGLILATVVQRAGILRSGQEARLEVVPVDPRDLFRGDYVVLNYRIGTVDFPKDAMSSPFTRGQQVFVTLRLDDSNKSKAVAISAERPAVSGTRYRYLGRCHRSLDLPVERERGQRLQARKPRRRGALWP